MMHATAALRYTRWNMPAYVEAVLPDKGVADIHAFLQSLPGRRPTKDVPILNN